MQHLPGELGAAGAGLPAPAVWPQAAQALRGGDAAARRLGALPPLPGGERGPHAGAGAGRPGVAMLAALLVAGGLPVRI